MIPAMNNKPKHHPLWEKRFDLTEEAPFPRGKQKFFKELIRSWHIFVDCVRGFLAFRHIDNCVTVFGSSRFKDTHPFYNMARELGQHLANDHFTVMTGGGPGIMEAANRGAKDKNGKSIGCNIELIHEEKPNLFLDKWITFHYFFVRKVTLTKYSSAFVYMPGGFGTMDELFEIATLVQTDKVKPWPIVLMGRAYWEPLLDYLQEMLAGHGTIDETDIDLFFVTDSPKEAVEYIKHVLQK